MKDSIKAGDRGSKTRWLVFAALAPGLLGVTSDEAGLTVALPRIADQFNATIPEVQWVVLAYILTIGSLMIPIGKVADMVGHRRLYLIGAGIFLAALQLLIDRPGETGRVVGDVVAEEVEVAVLNGTGVDGLADNVSDDVKANGYSLGSIGDSRRMLERTIVMFAEGQRLAARSVAQALGVGTNDIRPITKSIARGAGGADVVVVAGEDRVL